MKKILVLSLGDFRNIARDATMLLMLFAPLAIFLLLRFAVPAATEFLQNEHDFQLVPYYAFIVCFMSMIPTMLFGLIFGLLILDERDEDIITFITVTPLGKSGYTAYKLFASYVISFLFVFVVIYGTHLMTLEIIYTIPIAAAIALEAPLCSLFLAAFAENKVAGLAYGKIIGLMYIAPFIVFFVNSNWQLLASPLPPYWIAKAFIAALGKETLFWPYILVGFAVHVGFAVILLKKVLQGAQLKLTIRARPLCSLCK